MAKSIESTKYEFESSSCRTPQYLAWHRLFKREFTAFLKSQGITVVKIGKPNHFDMSGFFQKDAQWWYFRIEDLRWSKDRMLVRTAAHDKDYTGGRNQYLPLHNAEAFMRAFEQIVR